MREITQVLIYLIITHVIDYSCLKWIFDPITYPRLRLSGKEKFYCAKSMRPGPRGFSTAAQARHKNIDPNFVSGFYSAEGCFHISLRQNPKMKIGWAVNIVLSLEIHVKDLPLLYAIQKFFGGIGYIHISKNRQTAVFKITKLKDIIDVIIPHFNKYPLLGCKEIDFKLWSQCVELMVRKEHLTTEGFHKIVSLRGAANTGLTKTLSEAFPNVVPAEKPITELPKSIDPNWLAGFTSGEGSFIINITESHTDKGRSQSRLKFQVPQHVRDIELLKIFIKIFNCGYVNTEFDRSTSCFYVYKLADIIEKVIPFFDKYPILGSKSADFNDFKKIAMLMKDKAHLTKEGLSQIRYLQSGMNSRRTSSDFGVTRTAGIHTSSSRGRSRN